jgi:hypothetical protein
MRLGSGCSVVDAAISACVTPGPAGRKLADSQDEEIGLRALDFPSGGFLVFLATSARTLMACKEVHRAFGTSGR